MKSYYQIELRLHKKKYPEYNEIVYVMIWSDFEGKDVSNYVHSKKEELKLIREVLEYAEDYGWLSLIKKIHE